MAKMLPAVMLGIVIVGGLGSSPREPEFCSTKFSAEAPGTGEEWLAWDEKTRAMFVFGYIVGHSRGSHQGCVIASDLAPSVRITPECLGRTRTFSGKLDSYVGRITEYYQKYPDDRVVSAVYVLPMLSDQDAKPLEEIHRMAHSCGLFMTL
jgi:hypothetical protein